MGSHAIELEVVSDETIGAGGFLTIRRLRLRNLRPDGSHSREWVCDFVERPRGLDAVVVALWRERAGGAAEVLLRDGLRPSLAFGRDPERAPLPEPPPPLFFTELVAGIIEEGERGEAAVRARASEEAWEEAGYRIAPEAFELLGGPTCPSVGMTAEKFWYAAARAPDGEPAPLPGDGSPMEEGATVRWTPLGDALAACARGDLPDAKTELALRRLADRLGAR